MGEKQLFPYGISDPIAITDVYKGRFFCPRLSGIGMPSISSAEDAEDCIAKFTSLVRARDKFPNHRSW